VKRALELSATAIVLVHNHPSGDPTPSRADIEMTKQIVASAKNLGIVVHDHIIVGRQGHASFRGLGLISAERTGRAQFPILTQRFLASAPLRLSFKGGIERYLMCAARRQQT
jgi:hypothetical protein